MHLYQEIDVYIFSNVILDKWLLFTLTMWLGGRWVGAKSETSCHAFTLWSAQLSSYACVSSVCQLLLTLVSNYCDS